MQSTETLQRKIRSAEDLASIVKTMKILAAVNIRQYEKAVESLTEYYRTVEMGLQIVLKRHLARRITVKSAPQKTLGAIVFGSDQGMCGQLNEQIISHALQIMHYLDVRPAHRLILAVGMRATTSLEAAGQTVQASLSVPGALSSITPLVQEILFVIEEWEKRYHLDRLMLFYSRKLSGASYRPHTVYLLPIDQVWLHNLESKKWPSPVLPTFTMEWDPLFSTLIREYLFVSLHRACAESLASENASRLVAMQGAERNIQERLEELHTLYRQQRQTTITAELLDIAAGFEALTAEVKICPQVLK